MRNNLTYKHLQLHEVEPPAELFGNVRQRIAVADSEEFQGELFLKGLEDYSVEPNERLNKEIFKNIDGKNSFEKKIILMGWQPFFKVAAALLLLAAAWLIFRWVGRPDDSTNDFIAGPTVPVNKILPLISDTTVKTKKPLILVAAKRIPARKKSGIIKTVNKTETFQIGDYNLTVYNNDIFAALTNLDPNNLPTFITGEIKGNINFRIDRSTEIVLSEGMQKILKRMYATRKNGKSTNRAKRQLHRLKTWKSLDKKYFDDQLNKNPMDPVDLGEFVF